MGMFDTIIKTITCPVCMKSSKFYLQTKNLAQMMDTYNENSFVDTEREFIRTYGSCPNCNKFIFIDLEVKDHKICNPIVFFEIRFNDKEITFIKLG